MKKQLLIFGVLGVLALGVGANGGDEVEFSSSRQEIFKANVPETYVPWEFDEKADVMVDDFYEDKDQRTLSGDYTDSGFSYAELDVAASTDAEGALYKYASASEKNNSEIILEVNISESVDLSKLMFNVRGGGTGTVDAWSNDPLCILETINSDGETNSEIKKGEWVTIRISVPNSFSDATYSQGSPTVSTLGFAFYNTDATNEGTILLRKVSVDQTVIDDFNRETGNPPNCYWAGYTGTIIERNATLGKENEGTYTYSNGSVLTKANPVIRVKGDLSGMSLALVASDGTVGVYKSFNELKDWNNEALPTSRDTFTDVAISLENSGFNGEFAGISIKSTTEISIKKFYVSDCEIRETNYSLPTLDLENASLFNDFNITQAGGSWNTAYGEAPEALKEHGISYATTYANSQGVSLDGNNLVLPVTDAEYGHIFFGLTNDCLIKDYFVLSVKASAADLNDFRLVWYDGQTPLYYNSAVATYGISTSVAMEHNYEYRDGEYTWLIFDLAENNLDTSRMKGELHFYWGGNSEDILIDQAFYADAKSDDSNDLSFIDIGDSAGKTITPTQYVYAYGGKVNPLTKYFNFKVTATEDNASLESFRIEFNGQTLYLKDAALLDPSGNPISALTLKAGESQEVMVDFEKSGFDITKGGDIHLHFGGVEGLTLTGSFKIDLVKASVPNSFKLNSGDIVFNEVIDGGYNYLGGMDVNSSVVSRYLKLVINAPAAVENALSTFRIGFDNAGGTRWISENAEGQLLSSSGEPFSTDLVEGDNVYYIDLKASNIDLRKLSTLHFHYGGIESGNPGLLTLKEASLLVNNELPYMEGIPEPDYESPKVTISTDKTSYKVGDTVSITINATDNVTTAENLDIDLTVTTGSGATYEEVTVSDNKFVVNKAGTYTITAVVTDEANMSTTEVAQVSVIEDTPTDPGNGDNTDDPDTPKDPEPNNANPNIGAIVGGVIGGIVGVGIIGFLVWFFLKRKKAK